MPQTNQLQLNEKEVFGKCFCMFLSISNVEYKMLRQEIAISLGRNGERTIVIAPNVTAMKRSYIENYIVNLLRFCALGLILVAFGTLLTSKC